MAWSASRSTRDSPGFSTKSGPAGLLNRGEIIAFLRKDGVAELDRLVLHTRGTEVECCSNPTYRPAIESALLARPNPEVVAPGIVVKVPRRWKKPRSCKVRTSVGDLPVTAAPQPDKSIRLEGKNIAAVAAALHLKRS